MSRIIKIILKILFVVVVLIIPFSLIVGAVAYFGYKYWEKQQNKGEDEPGKIEESSSDIEELDS